MQSLAIPGWFGEGVWRGRVGALRALERAVMLTAVQSLRLLVRRGVASGIVEVVGDVDGVCFEAGDACLEGFGGGGGEPCGAAPWVVVGVLDESVVDWVFVDVAESCHEGRLAGDEGVVIVIPDAAALGVVESVEAGGGVAVEGFEPWVEGVG